MQVSKQAFTYVFDRKTGEPVWPIEERPVPRSTVPGERSSPTQPFPTKPPPFDLQGTTEENLIDFTPELKQRAAEQLKTFDHGAAVHAAGARQELRADAGHQRRRQLGRRGVRSGDGHALRAVADVADGLDAHRRRSEAGQHALRPGRSGHRRRSRPDRRPVDLQAALCAGDRHRHESGRHCAGRRRSATDRAIIRC